jgi:hypothetical protein
MFTALELREMRADEVTDRPDVCTIYEPPASSASDYGQEPDAIYPDDWTALLTNEPCLFYATQAKGQESAAAGQVQDIGDFQVEIRYNATRPSSRARVKISGLSYEIVIIRDSSYSIAMIIGLKRVSGLVETSDGEAILDSNGAEIEDSNNEPFLDQAA